MIPLSGVQLDHESVYPWIVSPLSFQDRIYPLWPHLSNFEFMKEEFKKAEPSLTLPHSLATD
jgi:hypothetical protein